MKRILMTTMVLMLVMYGWYHYYLPCTGEKIESGYTYKMVENILGTPGIVEHQDKMTKWVYTFNERKKIFFFENGKVVISYSREL